MQIISLDKNRIIFTDNFVFKRSDEREFNSLKEAFERVSQIANVKIGEVEYEIKVPKVISFSEERICMERCFGENLELKLRSKESHNEGVLILNELLKHFLENKFFWKDFAPRNVLIDENVIYIMDFERGIGRKNLSYQEYFVDIVYEEYAAFLLPEERIFELDKIFEVVENTSVNFYLIKSRRVKEILRLTCDINNLTYENYVNAIRLIIAAETPKIHNDDIVYPIVELEDFMRENGVGEYAKIVVGESSTMKRSEVYNPFNTKEYKLVNFDGKKFLEFNGLNLELSPNGYIPKSGLLYDIVLNKELCEDKKVLDLGCGYLGILGVIAYQNGAKQIHSIDYDNECVKWFNKLIRDNNLEGVKCFYSDMFSNIGEEKYDIILSNPPQMPMTEGAIHDSGGLDGRDYILDILNQSKEHLTDGGSVYILVFDFLGLDKRTNDNKSLEEIAKDYGYKNVEVLSSNKKIIKQNSVTYDSMEYISKIYPNYEFKKIDNENYYCNILIAKFNK